MITETLISTDDFCVYHQIEHTFVASLEEEGLLHFSVVNNKSFIPGGELSRLERMVNLHRDLEINVAGIASINHLLQQIELMQNELGRLKSRLGLYED